MATPLAGELVRASDIVTPRFIKKAASESVTSSTTLQDDNDFVVTLEANKTYQIELFASVSGATAGDVKFAWVVTGGVAQLTSRHCVGPQAATADVTATSVRDSVHALTTSVPYGTDNATNSSIRESFLVETTTAGTTGTLTLQWAQNASSATATTLSTSSFLIIREVEAP